MLETSPSTSPKTTEIFLRMENMIHVLNCGAETTQKVFCSDVAFFQIRERFSPFPVYMCQVYFPFHHSAATWTEKAAVIVSILSRQLLCCPTRSKAKKAKRGSPPRDRSQRYSCFPLWSTWSLPIWGRLENRVMWVCIGSRCFRMNYGLAVD